MPDRDYYEVLEVSRDATPDQIKKAYRTLARKYHPDVNPGDKTTEARFKEVQSAYDVLSDPEKRALFDRHGMAAFQAGHGPAGPRSGASEWAAQHGAADYSTIDLGDLFGQAGMAGADIGGEESGGLFEELLGRVRGGRPGGRRSGPRPGRTTEASLSIPFETAVRGGETTVSLQRSNGQVENLAVKIPAGIETGAKLRLRGRGEPGSHGAAAGDLVVTVGVEPHRYFEREGHDLTVEVPVTLGEAVLGARIDVPTLDGLRTLPIPAGTSSGRRLRLRGQGVPARGSQAAGDLFVVLKVVVPKNVDDESQRLIREFEEKNPLRPREGLW